MANLEDRTAFAERVSSRDRSGPINSTARDVAERAGVSIMTVSRVINGGGVRPDTRQKVQEAIRALDYVPNAVAKGLLSSRSGTLGLIVPDIVNPFFARVVRGAETVARRSGYRVLLCNTEGDLALERQYVEDMLGHRAEGILIAPVSDRSRDVLSALVRRDFPLVLLDRSVAGLEECDVVQGDSVAGARRLTEHLIDLGHRRIGLIIEPDNVSTARERVRGYLEALGAAGIDPNAEWVMRTSADREGGFAAASQLIHRTPLPTALFSVNNRVALGAADALQERGLSVPEDMGLVCFDDVEHLAVLSPFLTVMDQPSETFGTIGTRLLLDRIHGNTERGRRVVLPPRLIVRRSAGEQCGPREA